MLIGGVCEAKYRKIFTNQKNFIDKFVRNVDSKASSYLGCSYVRSVICSVSTVVGDNVCIGVEEPVDASPTL